MATMKQYPKIICVQCEQPTYDNKQCHFTCYLCQTGPLCGRCIANDIEHEREEYPLCDYCIYECYWCICCETIICFQEEENSICKECSESICDDCIEDHEIECVKF
jgi:hypothetical protein